MDPDWEDAVIDPYYDHKGIIIYHGDCKDVLPQLSKVDLILTDPPYGIGESNEKNSSRDCLATTTDFGHYEWDYKKIDKKTINHIITMANKTIIFGGNYYNLPPANCWLIWDKDNGANDFADAEIAWTNLKKAIRLKKYRWQGMLQEHMGNKEVRIHPTQKPVEVMRWCIMQAGGIDSILDPFVGSGTTLIAAKQLNCKAIGIEIEEKYCELAAKRLSQEVMEFD